MFITLQQKLSPSVDPVALMGISLLAHPRLLQQCPVPPLGCCCCTSTQTPYPVNQATSLIPHPLNTEPPPNLSSENGQLPLLTPPPQSFPALEHFCPYTYIVHCKKCKCKSQFLDFIKTEQWTPMHNNPGWSVDHSSFFWWSVSSATVHSNRCKFYYGEKLLCPRKMHLRARRCAVATASTSWQQLSDRRGEDGRGGGGQGEEGGGVAGPGGDLWGRFHPW